MSKSTEIRTGRHCVFAMHVHLVFVCKYRKKIFTKEHLDFLRSLFQSICKDFESELIEFNGESDHIHLLINYPPKVCISKLVNSLKGVSSRKLKDEFPDIKKYYWKNALWSPSYFAASCGGAPLNIIKQYIENQDIPK
jgi:putative transposase